MRDMSGLCLLRLLIQDNRSHFYDQYGPPLNVSYCTGSYQEPASQSGNGKARPPPGTPCVQHKGKICQKEKGRWGSSFCNVAGGNWGAECVVCSGNSSQKLPVLKFERKWSTQLK